MNKDIARRMDNDARQTGCIATCIARQMALQGKLQGMDGKGKQDIAMFTGDTYYRKSCNTTRQ